MSRILRRTCPVLCLLWLAGSMARADRREDLLAPTKGQLPTDTASDGKSTFTVADCPQLGGKAMKVVFAPGDTFGDRSARVVDWKPFIALEFSVFNPAAQPAKLTLVVRHRRSTSYPTRVDMPFVAKPGRSDIRLGIDEMLNVNGSTPDLTNVVRWYIASEEGTSPTLFFTDLVLVGDAPVPVAIMPTGLPWATGLSYRIRGKVGDWPVDLTVTPEPATAAAAAAAAAPVPGTPAATGVKPTGDPARLARIHAAKMPPITAPVMFNTPEADAILSALEVFPPDNPWNQLVSDWPVHPNSKAIVATVGLDKPLRGNADMGFILVPPTQPKIDVKLTGYGDESDKGPYPVPPNVPIEGWPALHRDPATAALTLDELQRDALNTDSDRHALVVDPVSRMLYEFYQLKRVGTQWQASQASIFDLKSNTLRPTGWTSTDAAGLPIFPSVVRYDELQRGVIDHALRVTIRNSQRAFVPPATHFASRLTDTNLPRMGERLRLRQDFDVSGFSPQVRTILTALKRYGMLVADNGIEWALSIAPDERIPEMHEELRKVKGSDFEVVVAPK